MNLPGDRNYIACSFIPIAKIHQEWKPWEWGCNIVQWQTLTLCPPMAPMIFSIITKTIHTFANAPWVLKNSNTLKHRPRSGDESVTPSELLNTCTSTGSNTVFYKERYQKSINKQVNFIQITNLSLALPHCIPEFHASTCCRNTEMQWYWVKENTSHCTLNMHTHTCTTSHLQFLNSLTHLQICLIYRSS